MRRLIATLIMLANSAGTAPAQEQDARIEHGKTIANELCAECHAIGASDEGAHLGAPPFRTLARRVDLDAFLDRLRGGLTSGHPDMPTFRFTREDARALIAYLRSIQRP